MWNVVRPDVGLALDLIDLAGPPELARRDARRPLYVYGRGELARLAVDYFARVGEAVACQFDRSDDLTMYGESGIPSVNPQVAVAVSACPYAPIEWDLCKRGFRHVAPFYDLIETIAADHPLQNGWVAVLADEDRREIRRVFGHLEDERSRANYLSFLGWRAAREEWNFPDAPAATVEDRYFVSEVLAALSDDETFLDGGAYDGRVTSQLVDAVDNLREIVAVEVDPVNFSKLGYNLFERPTLRGRSRCFRDALSDRDGAAWFYGGYGLASRLRAAGVGGGAMTTTRRIDSLDVSPTFVKLHLEGGELAALRGAEETLRRCRPVVAATTYHTADGVWRILAWMVDHLEDYRFLWRNHGWCGTGAVAYAIPRERRR